MILSQNGREGEDLRGAYEPTVENARVSCERTLRKARKS